MSTKKGTSTTKLIAVIVAETIVKRNEVGGLAPMVPTPECPTALMRICNTTLLDYVLEKLVQNGIDVAFVLMNKPTYPVVVDHMQTTRSTRGKSWLDSREMKVQPVESSRQLDNLFSVVEEIIFQNLIPEGRSFLWVPIDTLTNMVGLRDIFARHEYRVEEVQKYAATMIAAKDDVPMRMALEAAVVEQYERQRDAMDNTVLYPTTPVTSQVFPGVFNLPQHPVGSSTRAIAETADRVVVAFDPKTMVVKQLQRLEMREDAAPITIELSSRKERLQLRTDLVFSDLMIVSPGGLSLFKFHNPDITDVLCGILSNQELEGNNFGLDVCSPDTMFVRLQSIGGYLYANWCVMSRLLYPLTRESNFADLHAHYSLSHHSHSVYLHSDAHILGSVNTHTVVGAHTVVPETCKIRRSVVGKNVVIGRDCIIEGCVIGDRVAIGDGCVLRDSVVCADSTLGIGVELSSFSLIGSGVVMCSSRKALCLDAVRIEKCPKGESDPLLVGDLGVGRGVTLPSSAVNTLHASMEALFTNDAVPVDDAEEEEEGLDAETQFFQAVQSIIELAIRSPSRIANVNMELKNIRIDYGKRNGDVAKIAIQVLLQHSIKKAKEHHTSDPKQVTKEAFDTASALISRWCQPFFAEFVTSKEDMQRLLEGVCLAIHPPTCPLLPKAAGLLEWLYNGCDETLYDKRGYCMVSGDALLEFDEGVAEMEEEDPTTLDDEDRAVLAVGARVVKYIDQVRKFLEEDEGEGDG